jgi:hypothetical protein
MTTLVLGSILHAQPNDPPGSGCERDFNEPGELSERQLTVIALEGVARWFGGGHAVAQTWRRGPRDATVILRLRLSEPALNECGLIVAARVRNGAFDRMAELDAPDTFGLRRDDRPDFALIRDLDRDVLRQAVELIRRERGVDAGKVRARVLSKVIREDELQILVEAVYPRDDGNHAHKILFRRTDRAARLDDLG